MGQKFGALIADPAAMQELVAMRFTSPGRHFVNVTVSSPDAGMQVLIRLLNHDSTVVKMQIPVNIATDGLKEIKFGPLTVERNETLQVLNRNALASQTGEEMQANIFTDP